MGSELRLSTILEDRLGVLERMAHRLETLDLQLEHIAFLHIWISTKGTNDTTHQAFLGVIGEFAFDSSKARFFSEEHVVRGLDARLFARNV